MSKRTTGARVYVSPVRQLRVNETIAELERANRVYRQSRDITAKDERVEIGLKAKGK